MVIIQSNLDFKSNITTGNIVKKLVIHNSGDSNTTVEGMHSYHKGLGWAGIGYHYVVYKDGTVCQCRQDNVQGCHAGDANYNSLGICFVGNYNIEDMPIEQIKAGQELIKYLSGKYGLNSSNVYKHKDFMNTDCPGAKFPFETIVKGTVVNEVVEKEPINQKGECKLLKVMKYKVVSADSRGDHVKMLQSSLTMLGYNVNGIDGHCGPGCISAIKKYQSDNGLSVDGSCGPATWEYILTN